MKTNREKTIQKLTSKVLKETLESKIKDLEEDLGGMEDEHPRFGKSRLPMTMTKDEIDALFNEPIDSKEIDLEKGEEKTKFNPLGSPKSEFDEGFDSHEVKRYRRGKDFEDDGEFEEIPIGMTDHSSLEDDSTTPGRFLYNQIKNLRKRYGKDEFDMDDETEEFYEGKGMCEQCGSKMNEGECTECGSKWMEEGIYDVEDLDDSNEFDYVQEEDMMSDGEDSNDDSCEYHMKQFGPEDERTIRFCKGLTESLKGKQKLLDKNKNGRLDSADFKMLRAMKGKKSETKEGKKFPDLSGDGKVTRKDILMGRGVKLGKKKQVKKTKVKESIELTEDQLIDLIEKVVSEQKSKESNIKNSGTPKGLTKYKQVHDKDKKQNDEYLKSVAKKMKDYLKDGSKGEYNESPKFFPKGNGELAKMSKKAYVPSDAVKDYTDNLTAAGLENLVYDEIHPNEEWVTDNIEGSSRTGNNPEWANTGESDVNKKRNKIRKDNLLGQIKKKAYNKAPQPIVTDKTGEDAGDKLMAKLESIETKEKNKINEEFGRMKQLLSYNRKTQ